MTLNKCQYKVAAKQISMPA